MSGERFFGVTADASSAIARVAVDVPLPHLDRFFDYSIPADLRDDAVVGARVHVRFAGRTVPGFIVDLPQYAEVSSKLSPLSKVISSEPVLKPTQISLIRAVADHCAGVFADVARLAVPPRHATTENAAFTPWPEPQVSSMPPDGLHDYAHGDSFLARLSAGGSPRAHWLVSPRHRISGGMPDDWTRGVVQATVATLRSRRSVIIVVPDRKDLVRAGKAIASTIGRGALAELHADLGPAVRYRNYLALSRGQARVVVGTRPAVFAPLDDLGLIIVVDDGDDLLSEPRAPYPHARDVAALRAMMQTSGMLVVSHYRSCEVQGWISRGWMAPIEVDAGEQRQRAPAIRVSADSDEALARDPHAAYARLPRLAFETIRNGLVEGPVLIHVPRGGYFAALACQNCRTQVRCQHCRGPVRGKKVEGMRELSCMWCGRLVVRWSCPVCGGKELRAPVIGSTRTAEELGRAFPGYRLIESSGEKVKESVGAQPAIVVATPGAEPLAEQGYAALIIMDAHLSLSRIDLRAGEEALRRWLNAIALVRPAREGGTVCLVGPSEDRVVQAVVRMDAAGFAQREWAERREAGFPPAVRFIEVDGEPEAVLEFLDAANLPESSQVLGPVEKTEGEQTYHRVLIRSPLSEANAATAALKAATGVRSARKSSGVVRVRVDPIVVS